MMSPSSSELRHRKPLFATTSSSSEENQCSSLWSRSKIPYRRKLVSPHKVLPISGEDHVDVVVRPTCKAVIKKGITFPLLFLFLSLYCIELSQCASQVSPSTVTGLGKPISSSSSPSRSEGKGNADDNESSSNHHHNYHHRHHHRQHSSSGKNSQHSSPSASTYPSTSAYGYPDYYTADSFYEPRYYERPSREFSARSTSYPAMAAAASNSQVGFAETEFGGLALATGHHGGHHDGGHGGGYGHGHGHGHGHATYYKTVNKLDQSSLGLLGLLGLLSLLSNVLMLLTTTARASSMAMDGGGGGGGMVNLRIKRDAVMLVKLRDREESREQRRSVVERLSRLILPSLNIVGHAKDGRIPINCTYQEVCKTNRVLIEVFGTDGGRPMGSVMSTAIAKLLSDNNNKRDHHYHRLHNHHRHHVGFKLRNHPQHIPISGTSGAPIVLIEKLLTQAGLAGRNGEDCEIAYPTCEALSAGGGGSTRGGVFADENEIKRQNGARIQLPFLISPERAMAIILGQNGG